MLRVRGADIVDGKGRPVVLRGVSFGNDVWANVRLPRRHHDETDYRRVAAMGMNAVRFYMNYKTFEDDAAPGKYLDDGWQWLDDNIAWAKAPRRLPDPQHARAAGRVSVAGQRQGAVGSPRNAGSADRALDRDRDVTARTSRRSPATTCSTSRWSPRRRASGATWRRASRPAIRTVDAAHMLFVERLNAVAGDWSEDAERDFFRIADPNTVYEFHFYKPFHFTHQSASWVPFAAENVRYPDTRAEVEWFLLDRKAGTEASPKLPPGDSPWTFYPGAPFRSTIRRSSSASRCWSCKQATPGKVWFDDLTLEELDDAGKVKRVIWEKNLTGTRGWYFWTKDGKGGAVRSENGHGDGASIVAAGTVGDANLGADVLRFRTAPGATYRLSGWMRGEKIPPTATCQIRLDFFSSRAKVQDSDRAFMAQEIDAYLAWGKREKVPLFLGETGVIRFGFDERSRRPALGVGHARHRTREQAVVHVSRVPRGRFRHLPWQRQRSPIRRAPTPAHRAVHVEAGEEEVAGASARRPTCFWKTRT